MRRGRWQRGICTLLSSAVLLSCVLLSSCWRSEYPKEKEEAKRILSYLQETDCLGDLTLWNTRVFEKEIELNFWGDCDLQKVFSTAERANQYLETHPESIFLENDIDFRIAFFPKGSVKRTREMMGYFACVQKKAREDQLEHLYINTEECIMTSDFLDCEVSFKSVNCTYNVVFDDPEALLHLNGLQSFTFDNAFVPTDKETLASVLQSVCYYEDNGILPKFDFIFFFGGSSNNNEELRSTYKDFVESHSEYTVFHPLT